MSLPLHKIAIHWFRYDLRIADNEAFSHAVENSGIVIPIFMMPPAGMPGSADTAGREFLLGSLRRLEDSLKPLGLKLIVISDDPNTSILNQINTLTKITTNNCATLITTGRCYDPLSLKQEEALEAAAKSLNIEWKSFPGNYLLEPWENRKSDGTPYKVFTPFKKAALDKLKYIGISDTPNPSGHNLHFQCKFDPKLKFPMENHVPPKPFESLRGLYSQGDGSVIAHKFIRTKMQSYDTDRDFPAVDGTSQLSPYLVFGEISIRQIWVAIEQYLQSRENKNREAADTFRSQLIWRDFACHLLYHFPQMQTSPLRAEFLRYPWDNNKEMFEAWKVGKTGYPIVDAGMRQLLETGWMHNRVRMIVGSFLVKDLLLPWQWGEEWFRERLVDYDIAQNAMNWQWVAGCGADASPFFRIFNPTLQGEKFDKSGDYVRQFIPELGAVPAKFIHKPWLSLMKSHDSFGENQLFNDYRMLSEYPKRIVDHDEARLEALRRLKL